MKKGRASGLYLCSRIGQPDSLLGGLSARLNNGGDVFPNGQRRGQSR